MFKKNYNSIDDFAADLHGEVVNVSIKRRKRQVTGSCRLAKCIQLMLNGDAESAAKIRAEGDIETPTKDGATYIESAMVGCIPNIPAYLSGLPKQMLRVNRRQVPRHPIIDIYVDVAQHIGEDMRELARQSAQMCNAIAATELADVRINLYCVYSCESPAGEAIGFTIKLKDASAPLNLLNIAFPLLNAEFQSLCCAWCEQHYKSSLKTSRGLYYGYTCHNAEEALQLNGCYFKMGELTDRRSPQSVVVEKINKYIQMA